MGNPKIECSFSVKFINGFRPFFLKNERLRIRRSRKTEREPDASIGPTIWNAFFLTIFDGFLAILCLLYVEAAKGEPSVEGDPDARLIVYYKYFGLRHAIPNLDALNTRDTSLRESFQ